MLYITTLVFIFLIIYSSNFLGILLTNVFKLNFKQSLNIPLGLTVYLGIGNIFVYPIVYLHLQTFWLYAIYATLFIIGVLYSFKFYKRVYLKKINWTYLLLCFIYVLVMVFIVSRYALAEESFDTVHYLQLIQETIYSPTFTSFDVDRGIPRDNIFALDDYQSYYYFMSFVVSNLENLVIRLSTNVIPIITGSFIWIFSVLFYTFNFSVVYTIIDYFKISSKPLKLAIGIFILLFIGNIYYYNVFAFYGNSYRSVFASLLLFLTYKVYKESSFNFGNAFLIMLVSSSLISVSAAGYFIGFFILYGFVYLLNEKRAFQNKLRYLLILILPTYLFIIFFFNIRLSNYLVFYLFLTLCAVLLDKFSSTRLMNFIYMIIKIIMNYVIPALVLGYSIYLYKSGYNDITLFFNNYSAGDMTWDLFDFSSIRNLIVNLIYLLSFIYFIVFSKNEFKKQIVIVCLTFINPLSIVFVYRFLAGKVFYRSYESIFNTFFITLIFVIIFESISNKQIKRVFQVVFLIISISLSVNQMTQYYHAFFIPEDDFNIFHRLRENQVEVFEVLRTKIIFEKYERAKVISQIHTVKGFVPLISTSISFNDMRNTDRYSNSNTEQSPLHNIFIYRDYMAQVIYNTVPDYQNTCKYLIEEQIDFVIVAKNQVYMENDEYIPLFYRVRDCATQVFENQDYFLYQFYW